MLCHNGFSGEYAGCRNSHFNAAIRPYNDRNSHKNAECSMVCEVQRSSSVYNFIYLLQYPSYKISLLMQKGKSITIVTVKKLFSIDFYFLHISCKLLSNVNKALNKQIWNGTQSQWKSLRHNIYNGIHSNDINTKILPRWPLGHLFDSDGVLLCLT